jgi:hypothetical protein
VSIASSSLRSHRAAEDVVYAKVAWRLIPLLFLCMAAYLDRVNVAFAKLQMQSDVAGLSDTVLPVFWPMPTALLAGTAAAGGIAWINSVGNLAGFFGPSIVGVITDLTKRSDYGLYVASAMLLAGAALALAFVPKRYQVDLG